MQSFLVYFYFSFSIFLFLNYRKFTYLEKDKSMFFNLIFSHFICTVYTNGINTFLTLEKNLYSPLFAKLKLESLPINFFEETGRFGIICLCLWIMSNEKSKWFGIIVSSIFFSICHTNPFNFSDNLSDFLLYYSSFFFSGVVLSQIGIKYSIFIAYFLHIYMNFIQINTGFFIKHNLEYFYVIFLLFIFGFIFIINKLNISFNPPKEPYAKV